MGKHMLAESGIRLKVILREERYESGAKMEEQLVVGTPGKAFGEREREKERERRSERGNEGEGEGEGKAFGMREREKERERRSERGRGRRRGKGVRREGEGEGEKAARAGESHRRTGTEGTSAHASGALRILPPPLPLGV